MHFDVSDSLVLRVLFYITPLLKSLVSSAASQKVLALIPASSSMWLHQFEDTHTNSLQVCGWFSGNLFTSQPVTTGMEHLHHCTG